MKRTALFPGTFDPMTLGHEDIIHRASLMFDQVIVAVTTQDRSTSCLSTSDRLACAQQCVAALDNVSVCALSGLLVSCAQEHKAQVIVRSVRHGSDFDL